MTRALSSRSASASALAFALAFASALASTVFAAPPSDDGYELVRGAPPAGLRKGDRATVSLSILPRAGYRLLASGPVLVVPAGDGVRPLRKRLGRDDAVDPRADVPRFELPFVAERAGAARLDARCTFYVCKDERCRPVETAAAWTLDVAP